jgi:uncharacterized protein YukE
MPYVVENNSFQATHRPGFVNRRPSNGRLAGGLIPLADYLSIGEMVAWAQKEDGVRVAGDATYVGCSFDDRLFMLACLGVVSEDKRKGRGGHGDTTVLRDLFRMGQLDWDEFQKPSSANTRSFRYTAALCQELLKRIERSEDRVQLFGSILFIGTDTLGCFQCDRLEKDLKEARRCYSEVLETAKSMASTMDDVKKAMATLTEVTNFQAAFIGGQSDDQEAFVKSMEEHVKETMATLKVHRTRINKQEEGLEDANARITQRRKEIDNLNALVGVVDDPLLILD